MPFKLFQTKIEPRCAYCTRSATIDEGMVVCAKRGVISAGGSCRSFKYDPLKRVPPPPAPIKLRAADEGEFVL